MTRKRVVRGGRFITEVAVRAVQTVVAQRTIGGGIHAKRTATTATLTVSTRITSFVVRSSGVAMVTEVAVRAVQAVVALRTIGGGIVRVDHPSIRCNDNYERDYFDVCRRNVKLDSSMITSAPIT
jgi:hypothetical protein